MRSSWTRHAGLKLSPWERCSCALRLPFQSFTKFQDLLAGVSSVEDIDKKLDALMSAGKVDPALLLTTSKMYMSVKESPYTSEEVKDIMAHLYWRVRTSGACVCAPADQRWRVR